MTHRFSTRTILSLAVITLLVVQPVPSFTTEPPSSGTKRALLIGINRYQVLPTLNGSLNDIDTMRQVLTTRWGFQSQHITMLTDQAATRAGILGALERLVQDTGPSDVVYVHYSGHGSQVEDLNGDETEDHLDETLVPHDGRTPSVPDITDDELEAIVSKLKARSILIVLDSCHSGTATRSLDIRTRSVPKDTRIELYRPSGVHTRQVVPVTAARYVLMTGAAANQEALDGPVGGRYHGFFSYSLSRSLGSAGPSASPREIFFGVEREMKRIQTHFGRISMPEPQLEAPPALMDAPLLPMPSETGNGTGTNGTARLPWVEVKAHKGGETLLLNGLQLGAAPGSTWAVYPPNETNFAPGKSLGLLTVTQSRGKDAVAAPHATAFTIPTGSRAIEFLPPASVERVPVRLLDIPNDRREKIEQVLREQGREVQIVGPGQPAQFLVEVKGNQLQLYSADGLQLVSSFSLDNAQWGAGLARVLSRSANASELLTLDNPSAQIKLDVRIAGAARRQARGIAVVADTQPAQYRIRHEGEPRTPGNSLQLEIQATADSYLTIVDVDSEGHLNLLFPTVHQQPSFYPEGRVRAGDVVTIPDSLQSGNHAGFHWDYAPPAGTDTVRVFASTDLETAQAIRQRVIATTPPGPLATAMVTTRSILSSSMTHLRQDLSRIATRGLSSVYDPTPAALTNQPSTPPTQTPTAPTPGPSSPQPPVSQNLSPPIAPSTAQASAVAQAADWTATSLTIEVAP
ncbi:MAG: caspase family protein [Nitrospira sp.]